MKALYPDQMPGVVRRLGRALAGPELRARIAADLQRAAHLPARFNPTFRASRAELQRLKNKHRGETCVILGNGPSLSAERLAPLTALPTFCLNRGYLKWREQQLTPTYLVAVNDLVIEQFHDELTGVGCPLFVPWRYHELFVDAPHAIFLEMRWHHKFFADPRSGIWSGATVTFAAMQLAYHMGFARVLLVGVDHAFKDKGPAHLEVEQTCADANHFSPNYFGPGVRWNLPDLEQSEVAYRMAHAAFTRDGRAIIDCTRGGKLDIFPKMNLEDALAEISARRGAS